MGLEADGLAGEQKDRLIKKELGGPVHLSQIHELRCRGKWTERYTQIGRSCCLPAPRTVGGHLCKRKRSQL
eukprot:scaffold7074_cov19-Tisochrysis_lutea.AAC.1